MQVSQVRWRVMIAENSAERRLKFYGLNDNGTYFQVEHAARVIEQYNPSAEHLAADVLELHNALSFVESELFPAEYSSEQRAALRARAPSMLTTVRRFFHALSDGNVADLVVDVGRQYHADLLELFERSKVYDRCSAATILAVLDSISVHLSEMLSSRSLVRTCDQELRDRIMSDAINAELLLRKYLEKDPRRDLHLPRSFTDDDARALINAYLDSDDANPNFVQLVSRAPVNTETRIDAKTKLKARRTHDRWVEKFFKQNRGVETGCEVVIADDQADPVETSMDGFVLKLSYGRRWLEDSLDYPTILNNFLYVFELVDDHLLLTLPSYRSQLAVSERFFGVIGRKDYRIGESFRLRDQGSMLSIVAYDHFLRSKDIELESVIAWFFSDYLRDEYGAANFRFVPTSKASTFLEKCRHLFAEMESVVRQFALYVENGELDTGLLAVTSEPVKYAALPSHMSGKYVYPSESREIQNTLHLLFSDQSSLTYISESLQAEDFATLLACNRIAYDEFADHQKHSVDYLLHWGVLENSNGHIQFSDSDQLIVLKGLWDCEAVSYYHYPPDVRVCINRMVAKGWLVQRATLLSTAEVSYFNYYLNQVEFSNGPDLRNKYLHGSHADAADEDEHFRTYVTALRLLIALVLKVNDDFWLRNGEET